MARLTAVLLMAAFVAPVWLVQAATASEEGLAGAWQGIYRCGDIEGTFGLTVEPGDSPLLEGEFRFRQPDLSGEGSYRVRGRYNAGDRSFAFVPGDWIERPAGARAGSISGSLHENGLTAKGTLSACADRSGSFEFRADRESATTTAEGTPAVPADAFALPTGGPFEGHWRGAIACRDFDVTMTFEMLQDENVVVALSTIVVPATSRGVTTYAERRQIVIGEAEGDRARLRQGSFQLERPVVTGWELRLSREGRIDGVPERVVGMPGSWQCREATLTREGPPQTPDVPDGTALVGTWAGYNSNVALDEPPTRLSGTRTEQAEIVIAERDGLLYGSVSAASPVASEAVLQERFNVGIRPLFATEDGRVAFVSTAVRRAEGAYHPARRNRYPGDAFVLIPALRDDGALEVERLRPGQTTPFGMVLARMSEEAIAKLRLGEAPPAPLPPSLSGWIGEAATLEGQCRALRDWAQPLLAAHDPRRMPLAAALEVAAPLFDDAAFLPAFGLPYGLTTSDERSALFQLTRFVCPSRIGLDGLSGGVFDHAFKTPRGFEAIVGMVVDRQESGNWHADTMAEIEAFGEDASVLARLASLESEAARRGIEIPPAARAALSAAIAAKRTEVAVAEIQVRTAGIEGWSDDPDTLDRLAALLADASAVALPDGALSDLIGRARAKADGIVGPRIEEATAEAQEQPATLEGLAQATRLVRETNAVIARIDPALGQMGALERAQALHQVRMRLMNRPDILAAFRAELDAIEASRNAAGAVEAIALRYVDAEHLRGPATVPTYAAAVAAAVAELEIRSIHFADRSSQRVEGEPTARDMLLAVKAQFDAINAEISALFARCRQGDFRDDPVMALECLTFMVVGGGEQFAMHMTRFEKLGCADAMTESGFVCDYVLGFEGTSPFMKGRIEEMIGAGSAAQGRFVRADSGWHFMRLR